MDSCVVLRETYETGVERRSAASVRRRAVLSLGLTRQQWGLCEKHSGGSYGGETTDTRRGVGLSLRIV